MQGKILKYFFSNFTSFELIHVAIIIMKMDMTAAFHRHILIYIYFPMDLQTNLNDRRMVHINRIICLASQQFVNHSH